MVDQDKRLRACCDCEVLYGCYNERGEQIDCKDCKIYPCDYAIHYSALEVKKDYLNTSHGICKQHYDRAMKNLGR